jgi:hypothetical protein
LYPPPQPIGQQPPQNRYDQSGPGQRQEQNWQDTSYQGQPSYPPQQPYGQQPPFTPAARYGTPSGQPAYQGQPQYPPQPYGADRYPPGQPAYAQQPFPPQGYNLHSYQEAPRKRRRVFLWVFLAIQALFLIWIIAGVASKPGGPTVAQQVAQQCSNGGWQGLFKSQADCTKHYAVALNDATDTGKGIGVAIIVALWVAVDVILGIGYGIYRLARRPT